MGFAVYNNSTQLATFIGLIAFTPLGIFVTGLRFIATRRGARKLSYEDWLAVVATLFFISQNVAGIIGKFKLIYDLLLGLLILFWVIGVRITNGREVIDELFQSPSDFAHMRKASLIAIFSYFGHTISVKLSILAFYNRIFGVYRAYRRWIYVLAISQTIFFITICIFQGLQCRPLSKFWDYSMPGTCFDEGKIILVVELPNSLGDFAMVILAMIMIRNRQLPTSMKRRLRILFGLGVLVGIIGIVKIIITYSTDPVYAFGILSIWSSAQMFAGLLCCNLPIFYTMLPKNFLWSQQLSRMTSSTILSRLSRRHETKNLTKLSDQDSMGNHKCWKQSTESSGNNDLDWPEAAHKSEAHALNDFPFEDEHTNSTGIQIQRDFGSN
ncbi:hypothetical protein ACMFMF_006241 [Clarireedia jacksonii]